ncbi:unnamed protein product [Gadus morhua 'NCC']
MAAAQKEHEVPKSMLCPKFLHANSTSHTGPFSAIAELIDNAYDTDVNAKQIWIDKTKIKDMECLTFMDNGNGLNYELMHRMLSVMEEHQASLRDILDHSPFNTEEELLTELRAIESSCSSTGTRIIIWNLRRTSSGKPAIDFITDRYDIRIPCDDLDSSDPDSKYSLRAYCSVLYMKPRMQINIRGQKVKTQLISKSLALIAKYSYKPPHVKKIPITFGYNTKSNEHYGLMMYHKNRLIKAYHRVGCQKDANNKQGIGVIGVIECDFLVPTHNKQDFDDTDKYRNTIRNVKEKLEGYCKEMQRKNCNLRNKVPIEEEEKRPDQNWAQCEKCQQWRRMPDGINNDKLPEEWFCYMNPDPQFRHCETMEEPEDSDSEQPRNPKTYKIQEKEDKKKQEKTSTLKKPRTPKEGASASAVSTSSSHPSVGVITQKKLKRLQPTTPQNKSKRQKLDGLKGKLDMSPSSSTTPPTPVPYKDFNIDEDLLEGTSTPAPTEPTINPVGVRLESDPMDSAYVVFTSPRKSFVDEPTVTFTSTQMRDEEEMRDKSIQIWDEDEEEIRDKSKKMQAPRVKDEMEEIRDKSTKMQAPRVNDEMEEMRDKSTKMQAPRVKDEMEEIRDKSTKMQAPRVKDEMEEIRDKSTKMQAPRVKDEMEEIRDKSTKMQAPRVKDEMEEMRDKSTKMQGPGLKDEEEMNSSTAANDGAQGMEKIMISIIQEHKDKLMELLQSVSNERDSFKEKVKELQAQLEVEKQCADCQTAREKAELHLKCCAISNGRPHFSFIQYLHTNSTSHRGPFSAIAELIDNAYDPDVNAKQIWIDKTKIRDMECLTFRDDGNGLDRKTMQRMLSFRFSNKIALNGKLPIGIGSEMWQNRASLRDILDHSPFNTEEELLTELRAIEGPTGTKIIIWNLRRTSEGNMELDFTTENDIRIPGDDSDTSDASDTSVPESNTSLRAYCSILYLRPTMQINIRGQKVENHPIYESLEYIDRMYSYKPRVVEQKIPITFGYNKTSKEHYGLMMYYNNRLIKAHHRVGCQLKTKNKRSVGVIGVIECNHLKPTHNKQDFDNTDTYRKTIQNMALKLSDYSGKRRKETQYEETKA